MEYVKNSCEQSCGGLCNICVANLPVCEVGSIPQPYPNTETKRYFHYTPAKINDKLRAIDAFNPRVQLNQLIEAEEIDEKSNEKIELFCEQYIVTKERVLQHIVDARNRKYVKTAKASERASKRLEEQNKSYGDYNWHDIIEMGDLKKQVVPTLDKYIDLSEDCRIVFF